MQLNTWGRSQIDAFSVSLRKPHPAYIWAALNLGKVFLIQSLGATRKRHLSRVSFCFGLKHGAHVYRLAFGRWGHDWIAGLLYIQDIQLLQDSCLSASVWNSLFQTDGKNAWFKQAAAIASHVLFFSLFAEKSWQHGCSSSTLNCEERQSLRLSAKRSQS